MGKWSKVKAKTIGYVKAYSVPGISHIVTTKSYLLKLLSTILILGTFGVGVWTISNAVSDFYKFDTITDTQWVTPDNVTFPAITICAYRLFLRNTYQNGSVIKQEWSSIFDSDISRISHFLDLEKTYFVFENTFSNVSNHVDFFKIYFDRYDSADCFRFNAFTNKSVGLFKASSRDYKYHVKVNNFYIEDISENAYYNYSIYKYFSVYIGDNYLNSFEKLQDSILSMNAYYTIEIQKESTEMKLPEPYNRCKGASAEEPSHRWNCIEACIYKEVATKYNCTFPLTLFLTAVLKRCTGTRSFYEMEFSAVCLKECPFESCFYEKFSHTTSTYPKETFPNETFNYTEFLFYFRDLSSLNISQIPKTDPFTFLNNIGGGLGLFMGIALPNVIEFIQFISEIIVILLF
jgi:hypothetical protein